MPLRTIGQSALPDRPKIPNPGEKSGLVPVRMGSGSSMVRVLLPNGVVVESPEAADPDRARALLAGASTLR